MTDKLAGSHHGTPDLFDRDIKLLQAYQLWVKTAQDAGYKKDWMPGDIDMLKSRLFWRIRSGKAPLPEAPPCAFSCPWYELIEVPGPHDVWEEIRVYDKGPLGGKIAYVAQCAYEVIGDSTEMGGALFLKYNCYKFRAWNGMIPTRSYVTNAATGTNQVIDTERPGGWIEYIGNV